MDDSDIKLIDFGLARQCTNIELKTVVGTPYYVAPEVIRGKYDHRCDYWSLGVLMFVMLSGKPPFYAKLEKNIYGAILKGKFSFSDSIWKTISPEAKNIIQGFLTSEPDDRLTAKDALFDKWFF